MRGLQFLLTVLLLTMAPALARAVSPGAATIEAKSVGAENRQILVMLRMPPPHYRPSSGYGGNYGDLASRAARKRTARAIAERYGVELGEGWPMPLLGVDCFVMIVPPAKSIDQVLAGVSKEPGVAWSQRMSSYAIRKDQIGNGGDPLYQVQPTAREWNLRQLHKSVTGRGSKIAIIDSQVDVDHPDLGGQFVADKNFVDGLKSSPEAHGTHVAGIIGAKADNGIGIAGVAPGAKLMALRACHEVGSGQVTLCQSLALAQALQFAIQNGATVINLSLSGPRDLLLNKLLDVAINRRITVVAAFDATLPSGGFPASVHGVIPVTDEALQTTPNGVYGAPGRDVPTTQPGGGWSLVNGTSYAVAQVTGLAALAGEKDRRPFSLRLVRASDGKVQACATVFGSSASCQ